MSVKSRLPKIEAIAEQAQRTVKISKHKAAWGTRSLRDAADNYRIILDWVYTGHFEDIDYKVVSCECQFIKGVGEVVNCQGNNGTICYHALGCLMASASLKNKTLVLFDSFKDALCHSNLGNELVKVVNEAGGYCWATVVDKSENGASVEVIPNTKKLSLAERTNLLRGDSDDFID